MSKKHSTRKLSTKRQSNKKRRTSAKSGFNKSRSLKIGAASAALGAASVIGYRRLSSRKKTPQNPQESLLQKVIGQKANPTNIKLTLTGANNSLYTMTLNDILPDMVYIQNINRVFINYEEFAYDLVELGSGLSVFYLYLKDKFDRQVRLKIKYDAKISKQNLAFDVRKNIFQRLEFNTVFPVKLQLLDYNDIRSQEFELKIDIDNIKSKYLNVAGKFIAAPNVEPNSREWMINQKPIDKEDNTVQLVCYITDNTENMEGVGKSDPGSLPIKRYINVVYSKKAYEIKLDEIIFDDYRQEQGGLSNLAAFFFNPGPVVTVRDCNKRLCPPPRS